MRTALVTGSGKGIGRAIALALARDGFRVAVHYRSSQADAQATVAAIRADGGEAELFAQGGEREHGNAFASWYSA